MSEQPLVCCVMLTRDRPEMAKRAVECFRAQTYANKVLLIVNSGPCPLVEESDQIWEPCFIGADALTIGALRNLGNNYVSHHYLQAWTQTEIFVHWDDDDYSHWNRLAEQVTLLQASGADCVGYSDMLFWDTRPRGIPGQCFDINQEYWHSDGECADCSSQAWLYLGPQKALGTSLCYWRRTWERKPFPDQPRPGHANGEDTDWIKGLNLVTATSLHHPSALELPRMIASIHGANTSGSYKLIGNSTSWMRVPEFDKYCRKAMSL